MKEAPAAAIGFLVSPAVSAAVLAYALPEQQRAGVAFFPVFYGFSFFAALIAACPIFLVLKKLSLVRWWSASIVGRLIGLAGGRLVGGPSSEVFVIAGVAAAFAFWLVWFSCNSNGCERKGG